MFNKPSIAILIDCWDTDRVNPRIMYDNILNFLTNTPEITTIVIASYDGRPTYPKLLDVPKNCVTLTELESLYEFLEGIHNIYVFGANYSSCLRNRPLGYLALTTIPKVSILTVGSCVQENGERPIFTDEWLKLKNDIFLLKR